MTKWWQKFVWFMFATFLAFALFVLVSESDATEQQTDMRTEAFWKASTGDLWIKLYQEIRDEECNNSEALIYIDDSNAASYGGVILGSAFTSYAPSLAFSGSYDGPFAYGQFGNACPGTQKYYLWSSGDPNPNCIEIKLIEWIEAESSDPLTLYVGRFTGTSMQTGEGCEACKSQALYGFTTLHLADGTHPYWEAPAQAVTSAPSGCRPECSISEAKSAASASWGMVKHLYARP
jgi:hypothetical protein